MLLTDWLPESMETLSADDGAMTTALSLGPGTLPVLQLEPTSQSPLEVEIHVTVARSVRDSRGLKRTRRSLRSRGSR